MPGLKYSGWHGQHWAVGKKTQNNGYAQWLDKTNQSGSAFIKITCDN